MQPSTSMKAPPSRPIIRFWLTKNVILTPHVGGATDGTIARHSQMLTEALERFQQGLQPAHIVNPSAWQSDAERAVLVLDLGTSSLQMRRILYEGRKLATARAPMTYFNPPASQR